MVKCNWKELIKIQSLRTIDLQDIFKTRQWFYAFLGEAFYLKPDQRSLGKGSNIDIFENLKDEKDKMESSGAKLLLDSLKDIRKMTEEEFKEIIEEYNRLFLGPGKLGAAPWESVYLSEERIIFDEHTLSVREFYRDWGIHVNRKKKEPDDHIGFQLEFMSILSDKASDAIESNDMEGLKKILEAQKNFLEDHTLRWSGRFLGRVFENSSLDFFKGLALFTSEFLKMDRELVEDIERNIV